MSTGRKSTSAERLHRSLHKDAADAPGTGTGTGNGHARPVHTHTHPRSPHAHAHPSTASALKSIMEQGGLVELKPSTMQAPRESGIPTRAIGDPSTGTDTASLGPPSPQEGDAEGQALAALGAPSAPGTPTPVGGTTANATVRPSYVELPKRPTFSSSAGFATFTLTSSTQTPYSVSTGSTIAVSPSPTGLTSAPSSGQDSTTTTATAATTPTPTLTDSPLRVLVVDDDQLTRKLMRRMLQRLGCAVSTAENGQIAFDLITGEGRTPASEACEASVVAPGLVQPPASPAASASYDSGAGTPGMEKPQYDGPRYELVFLDNQMPVLSGLGLVSKLRQLGRTDFVVGVTGA